MSRRSGWAGLAVAVAAAGLLVTAPGRQDPPAPAQRVALDQAWPGAQRAELRGNLPDGPVFHPETFLDARTAVGTAPSSDGTSLRLLLHTAGGQPRELRRRPLAGSPEFGTVTVAGNDLVWSESTDDRRVSLWAASLTGTSVRRLTGDAGDAVFGGSQFDLVAAEGRVWWVTAGSAGVTQIRSVPLRGGPVSVREEPGEWALTAWPWITDGTGDHIGTRTLRALTSNREMRIGTTGTELSTCTPVWCRVMVLTGEGLARIDAMHPDGTARRRIAGGGARAAVTDAGVLDRFELLSEPGPDSDLTGTEGLLVYDLSTDRTVEVTTAAAGVLSRNGVLWWATGDQDDLRWHTLDLRTV
ncbi:hypothetical protein [Actinoplanes sp. N902-109]|uniref:hypothetical protein n=1 Tax=Actinoplanes sp. (strain N902-109) TaxID=649831 RepID=UPI0003296269|nr:hypothetical protein [Actinoplanes sp. N902-109]AGL17394.1 hypothetical protein L083_3884 [Actinoplanes sp. N902-109]